MRIYISAPFPGKERLIKAAALRLQNAGYEPVAATAIMPEQDDKHVRPGDTAWQARMRASAGLLIGCDGVALLPGWRGSTGSMIEVDLADGIGLPVSELEEWLS